MKDKPCERYVVIREFEVKSGEVAPWFGEQGKGMQYYTDFMITDNKGKLYEANVKNLIDLGYIEKI